MIGERLGHYQIIASLGSGRMGDVYRALDTRLDREVAIKILPDVFARDTARLERFQREAKALAALDHPNIAPIFAVQAIEDLRVAILQPVEGESLAVRLKQGPLPVAQCLNVGRQIAEALHAAHERGVIHRDLKPSNINLGDDRVVRVLDFGLAKLNVDDPESSMGQVMASPDSSVTSVASAPSEGDVVLGTPAYMSPEQAQGLMIDQRTDVWAFGCCLFEMLVAQRVFRSETKEELLSELNQVAPDWGCLPVETPGSVRTLLRRCLERDAHRRLSNMGDIALTLEEAADGWGMAAMEPSPSVASSPVGQGGAPRFTWGVLGGLVCLLILYLGYEGFVRPAFQSEATMPPVNQLAVLPFRADDDDFLAVAQGLEAALRADLRANGMLGTEKDTVEAFRDSAADRQAISKELNVDGVIGGRLRRRGSQLEVQIDLGLGSQPEWLATTNFVGNKPRSLERQVLDFAFQQFEVERDPSNPTGLQEPVSINLPGYIAYQKGLMHLTHSSPDALEEAVHALTECLELEPEFWPAHRKRANAQWRSAWFGGEMVTPRESLAQAQSALEALRVTIPSTPNLEPQIRWVGMMADLDWLQTKAFFDQALKGTPLDADLHYWRAWYLALIEGRYRAALRSMERAIELNPEWPPYRVALGELHSFAGDEETSQEWFEANPMEGDRDWGQRLNYALLLTQRGISEPTAEWLDRALQEVQKAVAASGRHPVALAGLAEIHAVRGESRRVEALLQELGSLSQEGQIVPLVYPARVMAASGSTDQAVDQLWRAFEAKEIYPLIYHMRKPDLMRRVAESPRYWELIARMNFPALPHDHPFHEQEQQFRWRHSELPPGTARWLTIHPFEPLNASEVISPWLGHTIQSELMRRIRAGHFEGVQLAETGGGSPGYQISGSFEAHGDELRLTAWGDDPGQETRHKLLDWTGPLDDLLEVIAETAATIVTTVQPDQEQVIPGALTQRTNVATAAYLSFQAGFHALKQDPGRGDSIAMECWRESMRLDPNFGAPYLGLARQALWLGTWDGRPRSPEQIGLQVASLLAVARERESHPADLAETEGWAALVGGWDWPLAYQKFTKAKSMRGVSSGLGWYYLVVEGRDVEAEKELKGAAGHESFIGFPSHGEAWVANHKGDWQTVIDTLSRDGLGNRRAETQFILAEAAARAGRHGDAKALIDQIKSSESHSILVATRALVAALAGDEAGALKALGLLQVATSESLPFLVMAKTWLALGDVEATLEALEQGLGQRGSWPMLGIRSAVFLQGLGEEARYWEIVSRMKLPELPVYHPFFEREQRGRLGGAAATSSGVN